MPEAITSPSGRMSEALASLELASPSNSSDSPIRPSIAYTTLAPAATVPLTGGDAASLVSGVAAVIRSTGVMSNVAWSAVGLLSTRRYSPDSVSVWTAVSRLLEDVVVTARPAGLISSTRIRESWFMPKSAKTTRPAGAVNRISVSAPGGRVPVDALLTPAIWVGSIS